MVNLVLIHLASVCFVCMANLLRQFLASTPTSRTGYIGIGNSNDVGLLQETEFD